MNPFLLTLSIVLFVTAVVPARGEVSAAHAYMKVDKLLVHKSERRLYLVRDDAVVATYEIALGRNPVGPKIFRGDGRTPEGEYRDVPIAKFGEHQAHNALAALAAAETVMGLFKNEAVAKDSPFRNGALKTESDVVDVVFEWVHWYNNDRLHSSLDHQTPEEFEQTYYDEISGSLPDAAAHKTAT